MTLPKSSTFGGPSEVSDGGGLGRHSSGMIHRTSVGGESDGGESEWMAGARMNIVLNGLVGFERAGMRVGCSNDSSWSGVVS